MSEKPKNDGVEVSLGRIYNMLTEIAGLYGAALDTHRDDPTITSYGVSADLVLADLSDACVFKTEIQLVCDKKLHDRILTLDRRFHRLQKLVNTWIDAERWPRLLRVTESCWKGLLEKMSSIESEQQKVFLTLRETSKQREQIMKQRLEEVIKANAQLNDIYAVPIALGE